MDEEIELKNNKNNVLTDKVGNSFDEDTRRAATRGKFGAFRIW